MDTPYNLNVNKGVRIEPFENIDDVNAFSGVIAYLNEGSDATIINYHNGYLLKYKELAYHVSTGEEVEHVTYFGRNGKLPQGIADVIGKLSNFRMNIGENGITPNMMSMVQPYGGDRILAIWIDDDGIVNFQDKRYVPADEYAYQMWMPFEYSI